MDALRAVAARVAIRRLVRRAGGRIRYLGRSPEGLPEATVEFPDSAWNTSAATWPALRDEVVRMLAG